ncbi:MAG TPA: hypothetical protein IAB31_05775 [Candidatus Choladousia intestinavium]|uniref:Uncharacterized protein n=1 Tax=Candidatus Choladousia intestinavium TaxID=2840727 RepID=A0A9D1AB67_9FIRM|nr:hypothetical protein [Candidatus Choladousia intestinavium]
MKVVELLAERVKIRYMLTSIKLYGTGSEYRRPFHNEEEISLAKQRIEDNREFVQKLLKRTDALHEADAKTYIQVMGCSLSVATARQYLSEFSHVDDDGMAGFDPDDFPYYGFRNFRWTELDICCIRRKEDVAFDPLSLRERGAELEEEKIDWYLGLKTAVAISDAVTEVVIEDKDCI